jgi:hypothetical protein
MLKRWLFTALVLGGSAVGLAFVTAQGADTGAAQEAPAEAGGVAEVAAGVQPIAFPHDTHAATYGMNCMYCHFSAERSVDAGMPPVATCAGCHRLIPGANNPEEVQKVLGFAQRNEAIPWVRIYKVADHVHFPHMRHINAGLSCQQCHGPVETMGPIEQRDPAWQGDNMGWCVSCHVEQGASRDCAVCHY